MSFELLYLLIGVLLVSVAILASSVKRLPLSEAMIYLAAGTALGPLGLRFLFVDPEAHSELLERAAEIAVIISLFTTGLKLRVPLRDPQWWVPLCLASGSMVLTVGMITLVAILDSVCHWEQRFFSVRFLPQPIRSSLPAFNSRTFAIATDYASA